MRTHKRGRDVLNDPEINKGTAFTADERRALSLGGLLPPTVETIDEQLARQRHKYDQLHDDLERHIYLRSVQDTNEVLFYRLLCAHLAEMLPIVYTPTVGLACQRFSSIYRRPHGVFLSYPERGNLARAFDGIDTETDVIVVTDGQRILGLGDQGAGGMGIPIGKLSLYTAAGGIDPRRTLPVTLDVGTDNPDLLDDPLYVGWRHERVTGDDYDAFIEEFVTTIAERFPGVLLQWEDFAGTNAAPLLDRYRHRLPSFNDDIQGTAAVGLATVEAAVAAAGSTMAEQRICLLGAGSAGVGIAEMVVDALAAAGVDDAVARVHLVDRNGLLHDRRHDLSPYQSPMAQRWEAVASWANPEGPTTLAQVVAGVAPTVLIGVSGQAGLFTEPIVTDLAARCDRPIIMPLSNPTSKAEAQPADLIRWTGGRALVATGSPFDPVAHQGRTITISQANNVYVFPGLGLGAVVSKASVVTDAMLAAAAEAVGHGRAGGDPDAGLLPPIGEVAEVSRRVAARVAAVARDEGVGRPLDDDEIAAAIDEYWWSPRYPTIEAG
ncbi:MAG: NAD-dependent malic enzyme [Actinomycetota bacterium]